MSFFSESPTVETFGMEMKLSPEELTRMDTVLGAIVAGESAVNIAQWQYSKESRVHFHPNFCPFCRG